MICLTEDSAAARGICEWAEKWDRHILAGGKTWTCPTCGRICLSESELKAHALLLHSDGRDKARRLDPKRPPGPEYVPPVANEPGVWIFWPGDH